MPIFVVQEHLAKRAGKHHDFRLEVGGVLESWAVPKGVPTTSGIRRLAVRVADHPIDYAGFEGEIEEGYGAGKVRIFDEGEYELLDESPDSRLVQLRGNKGKLKGNYYLRRWEGDRWLIWKR